MKDSKFKILLSWIQIPMDIFGIPVSDPDLSGSETLPCALTAYERLKPVLQMRIQSDPYAFSRHGRKKNMVRLR